MVSTPPVPIQPLPRAQIRKKCSQRKTVGPRPHMLAMTPAKVETTRHLGEPSSIRDHYREAVMITEHRWSPGLYMNLALALPTSVLLPNQSGGCQHSLEDVAHTHFRSSSSYPFCGSHRMNKDVITQGHTLCLP